MGLFIHDHPENRGCYKKDYRFHGYYEDDEEEKEEEYYDNSVKTSESYDYESTYQITLRKFRKEMIKQVEKLNSKEDMSYIDYRYHSINLEFLIHIRDIYKETENSKILKIIEKNKPLTLVYFMRSEIGKKNYNLSNKNNKISSIDNSKEILKIFDDFDYDKFNEFKNNFESLNK